MQKRNNPCEKLLSVLPQVASAATPKGTRPAAVITVLISNAPNDLQPPAQDRDDQGPRVTVHGMLMVMHDVYLIYV